MICGGVSRPDALYIQMGFLAASRAVGARQGRPLRPPCRWPGRGRRGRDVRAQAAERCPQARRSHLRSPGRRGLVQRQPAATCWRPAPKGSSAPCSLAYEQAGWSPTDVDLIECHATGAPVGDAVEVESLKTLWGTGGWRRGQCVIGSVKSNIGHALTAAGAAGLLKVLLALKYHQLPPTANYERSSPALGLEDSPFRVLTAPVPWTARAPGSPRRAAVSGFGFGGINAHVLIEEWVPARSSRTVATRTGATAERELSARVRQRSAVRAAPVAIVGMSTHFGRLDGTQAFQEWLFGADHGVAVARRQGWWGIEQTAWYRRRGWDEQSFPGLSIDSLDLRRDTFRIPPRELAEMLPQQLLMLKVARAAILDARWDARFALRSGVLIGIGLDWNTTNYHLRWSLPALCREWDVSLGLGLTAAELERWTEKLRDAGGPALTANRTMGSLGGMVASRIAREFRIGGPSFTVSSDETSGIQALAIAVEWLQKGELDAAIVGAVDLAGDVRGVLARSPLAATSTVPSHSSSSLHSNSRRRALRLPMAPLLWFSSGWQTPSATTIESTP